MLANLIANVAIGASNTCLQVKRLFWKWQNIKKKVTHNSGNLIRVPLSMIRTWKDD